MRKSLLGSLALLMFAISMVSGCSWSLGGGGEKCAPCAPCPACTPCPPTDK